MIITICGSTKFKDEILTAAERLTMDGNIVLMPCVFHHADGKELSTYDKMKLDNLHKEKIDMSDAIYVVNPNGYIGNSTASEIDWAERKRKRIIYLYPTPAMEYSDKKAKLNDPFYNPFSNTGSYYRPNTQIFSSTITGAKDAPKASYTYTVNSVNDDDEDGAPPGYKC